MRHLRIYLSAASLAVLATGSFAQTLSISRGAAIPSQGGSAPVRFVEKKGVREFTGRMIARPCTPTELQLKGVAASLAVRKAIEADLKLQSLALRQEPEVGEYIIRVPSGSSENRLAGELMATGLYKYVEPDYRVFYSAVPNDPLFSQQWHHRVIQSAQAWDIHKGGGTVVGIVDSGVDTAHLDLQASLLSGYNAADDRAQADGGDVTDIDGHGTHVSGCAAAIGSNGRGVVGVGWSFKILPVRASNFQGGLIVSDGLRGVRWAVDNGAKAVNCSWEGFDMAATEATGSYVKSRGGLMIFAAGNSAVNMTVPNSPDVFCVGASTSADTKAWFSNYGTPIDVFAPGDSILSTGRGGGYLEESGTSMASPITAGLATLVWSYVPGLTPDQVASVIKTSCDFIGSPAIFGSGRINSRRALIEAQKYLAKTQILLPVSASPSYGTTTGGSLASLSATDLSVYTVRSAAVPGAGQAASVVARYAAINPAKIVSFSANAAGKSSSGQLATASIFLYNLQTKKWDLASSSSFGLPLLNSKASVSSGLSRYMSATGEIQVMFRAYAQDTRLGGPAAPFSLLIDQLTVTTNSL